MEGGFKRRYKRETYRRRKGGMRREVGRVFKEKYKNRKMEGMRKKQS